jgi:hypothetical protein
VKLTQRGKDYLKAIILGTILATIFDVKIVLALCLSLIIAAIVSELILRASRSKAIEIKFENTHPTCFKGDEVAQKVMLLSDRSRGVTIALTSVKTPNGVDPITKEQGSDSLSFSFRPRYAGRFSGLIVNFELGDPLGLFARTVTTTKQDFVIDSYPISVLQDVRASRPIMLSIGDRSAKTRGTGQEFYSVDEYKSAVEKRDILWKKVAAMPDERLLVKIRESNIPRVIRVAFVQTVERWPDALSFMDLGCEGVALLGKHAFADGCDLELAFVSAEKAVSKLATETGELSDAIMEMSFAQADRSQAVFEILRDCDICVTGLREIQDRDFALAISKKPALLIKDDNTFPPSIDERAVIFDGAQDVGVLVSRVIGR